MFNLVFNICQYIIPVIGVIGFFINNSILMITAIIFTIVQDIIGYLTGQLKPGVAHIILSFI